MFQNVSTIEISYLYLSRFNKALLDDLTWVSDLFKVIMRMRIDRVKEAGYFDYQILI